MKGLKQRPVRTCGIDCTPLPRPRVAPGRPPPPRRALHVARVSFHDDCAHVFGEKGHIAGIPTCSKCSAVGARLRYTLRNRPHEFVALAREVPAPLCHFRSSPTLAAAKETIDAQPHDLFGDMAAAKLPSLHKSADTLLRCRQEMQEIIARPDGAPPARMVASAAELRRRAEAAAAVERPHYASIRSRLEASLSRSGVSALDADPDQPVRGVLPAPAKFQEVMDVLYFWALGEAYLQHPQLQADMRQSLGRAGAGPLAAEGDNLELRSRVQLLDGPFYEGSYLIGSVNFVNMASIDDATDGCGESGSGPGGDAELPITTLDAIWGSLEGRGMLAREGDQPVRTMRQSVARSYNLYQMWGYSHRSLAADRAAASKQNGVASTEGSGRRRPLPGRYFDKMPPGQQARWRTNEASAVADRHLRALFGEQEECITTMHAWQQMTHEAKRFGRALYDAEDFVLRACLPSLGS